MGGAGGGIGGAGGGMGGAGGGMGGAGGSMNIGQVGKVDLLLMIDNSRSMADKQDILAVTVPDLVNSLVNPACVDANGTPTAAQPASPADPCPVAGSNRVFAPVTDIHIGIVSSSIGGHGADACPAQENNTCAPNPNFSNDDKGRLLSRTDPCSGATVPTYNNKGFLAWDPQQKLVPPGEADVGALTSSLNDMVIGVGQVGCGYESQLESWYRFLVDPEPYMSISVVNGLATPQGTDATLLAQRKDFLRPDSLLAVVMLTDENDCSTKEFGQFFFANQLKNSNGTPFHLPRARSECAVNPNDPCCKSCGQAPGNCPADPTCVDANGNPKALTDIEDSVNLRCFEQKRRFGIDFLYPLDRYVMALTSAVVPNRAGDLVPNPVFSDLDPADGNNTVRDPGLVFLTGIVGVPWQDLARDPSDLSKGYKSPAELAAANGQGMTGWDIVVGDPAAYIKPKDPHMIESINPRSGTNPITGDAIAPPGSATNPINGSEYSVPNQDDLQYACIFPLPSPRDCSDFSIVSCDCKNPQNDNPLCEDNPNNPGSRTLQTKAKAHPGLRQLSLLQKLGDQAVAASVCPAQLSDPSQADYGYRPAVSSLVERIKGRLKP
ncbi:MAG: hypothetical protein HUU21_22835 [Polyangiaceae bacterium]|nr:hypothetical protein [Polyangiaceae bacterium]